MNLNRRIFMAGALAAASARSAQGQTGKPDEGFTLLEARPAEARLRGADAPATQVLSYQVLSYNGEAAPVLRIRQGEELKLRFANRLDAPTSLHFRGMRGPNAFDGVAPLTQAPLAPGATQDIRFTPPDAGTYYFHPHGPKAANQAGRGLGGVLIVEEAAAPSVDHDLVLALADWRLNDQGQTGEEVVAVADSAGAGRLGGVFTINGEPAPLRREFAPGARVRVRIVNMCMAQLAALTFEGATPQIGAIDSQACTPFEPVQKTFPIGPGARFDVFFDMPEKDGESSKIVLRRWPIQGQAESAPQDVALFVAKGARRPALPPLQGAAPNASLPAIIPLQNARRLDLNIARVASRGLNPDRLWSFNGESMRAEGSKPLFSVKRGTPVTLGFINTTNVPHVMRVHGHVMRQLHLLDDGWEPYWRDGVIVPDGKTVRIAFLADNPGKWRLGSGILAHAESGLSTWFEVT